MGLSELDNGEVDRVFRRPTMGAPQLAYARNGCSDAGRQRAAILMTLLETAALESLVLFAYFNDALLKIAGGWQASCLDELLPENGAAHATGDNRSKIEAPDAQCIHSACDLKNLSIVAASRRNHMTPSFRDRLRRKADPAG